MRKDGGSRLVVSMKRPKPKQRLRKRKRRPNSIPLPWKGFNKSGELIIDPPTMKFDSRTIDSILDTVLGMMFVDALKKTGTREVVLKVLFPPEPVEPKV
jgi:hypothetical protein